MADTIEDALLALSAVDQDHAQYLNDMGFNGRDTGFGNSLAQQLRSGRKLSYKQLKAAHKMLRTYRVQLGRYGIDYGAIPEPAPPAEVETAGHLEATVEVRGTVATLTMSDYHAVYVGWVKGIPGRRYDPKTKTWTFPLNEVALQELGDMPKGITLKNPEAIMALMAEREVNRNASHAVTAELEVEGLVGELMPFQKAGVEYAVHNGACFIADEMGLGKTVQAIASVQHSGSYPALMVVPAVVKLNWQREWNRWIPEANVAVLNGRKPPECFSFEDPGKAVFIINYDILGAWMPLLKDVPFRSVVFDESHYLKNGRAQRTKHARSLAQRIPMKLMLTGTPILNRPVELASQLAVAGLLNRFGGWKAYTNRYCEPRMTPWGLDLSGASNTKELHHKLREVGYIRRTKLQVLSELPPKRRAMVPLPLSNPDRYAETLESLWRWIREKVERDEELAEMLASIDDPAELEQRKDAVTAHRLARAEMAATLTKIEALKQVAAEEKLDAAISWISDFLDTGEKLVVFGTHHHILNALEDAFDEKAVMITGDTPMQHRQDYVDAFQDDPDVRLFIGNVNAAGVGITLTAASNVAFIELPWRPGDLDQAEDRCHRIGQTDSVTAWYLLAAATIDEQIAKLLDEKRSVVDSVTDGKSEQGTSMVAELIAVLRREAHE